MELIIAVVSIVISLITLWITTLHKGTIKMTRPTIIAFAFEGFRRDEPKLFLRTLLYGTSKQSIVVESLYVKLKNRGVTKPFTVWAYGDNGLVRGSGLSVNEQGVDVYHHFLTHDADTTYKFLSGRYDFEVYAVVKDKTIKLYSLQLDFTEELAERLDEQIISIFFDWNPDSKKYVHRIQSAGEIQDVNLYHQ